MKKILILSLGVIFTFSQLKSQNNSLIYENDSTLEFQSLIYKIQLSKYLNYFVIPFSNSLINKPFFDSICVQKIEFDNLAFIASVERDSNLITHSQYLEFIDLNNPVFEINSNTFKFLSLDTVIYKNSVFYLYRFSISTKANNELSIDYQFIYNNILGILLFTNPYKELDSALNYDEIKLCSYGINSDHALLLQLTERSSQILYGESLTNRRRSLLKNN